MDETNSERSALGTVFDRTLRALHGLPDTVHTKATTVRALTPVLEQAQTFIVQSYRRRDAGDENAKARDTIFIEYIGTEGSMRIALPPEVADVIARQRDSLGTKNRKASAKAEAARRKAQGIKPGFLKVKSETA